jgi:putative ABC transport system substrate-binding protein
MMIIRAALAVVLACTVLSTTRGAEAQEPGKVTRIGILAPRTRAGGALYVDPFVQGLRELGWAEGKNCVIEYRWAEGKAERLPALAAELVRLKVDVILAPTTASAVAARNATKTIPIVVAAVNDPVELGLAQGLARPGGNVTGLTFGVGSELFGKQLAFLKETVPTIRRVAVLYNQDNPGYAPAIRDVKAAASAAGVQLHVLGVRRSDEFERAFAVMARERAEALLVVADGWLAFNRVRLQSFVATSRLPAMYGLREHTEVGGLMSYATDIPDNFRRAATYVDKILKGAKAAELPIEQPRKFELVINLKTAKALSLKIPPSLLLRADQVIE